MSTAEVIEMYKKLSPAGKSKVEKQIEEIFDKENNVSAAKPRAKFGELKGFVKYMADDFDAPLEEFKDYM
jgi:hypothetical protein